MDDVVLFVCGGAAKHILEHSPIRVPMEYVLLGSQERDEEVDDPDRHPIPARARLEFGDRDGIMCQLDGIRVALVLSVLGGDTGSAALSEVVGCAKEVGCRSVAVVGVPMRFETGRREKAKEAVSQVIGHLDRMFIVDNQEAAGLYTDGNDRMFDSVFRMYRHRLSYAMGAVASMLEGPFFSTFYAKSYTFSYVSALDPGEAVAEAMDSALFPADPGSGKLIVSVGSGLDGADKEQVFQSIVSKTGIMPDIVPRDDLEDSRMLLFLPVTLDSSPRASRS